MCPLHYKESPSAILFHLILNSRGVQGDVYLLRNDNQCLLFVFRSHTGLHVLRSNALLPAPRHAVLRLFPEIEVVPREAPLH